MDVFVLAGLVKRLYPGFDLKDFSYRFKLQKFVFILKYWGLDLGYSFSLYLRGPYSPDLARDAFQIANWDNINLMKFQSDKQEKIFEQFLNFMKPKKDDENWLEVVSTLLLLTEEDNGKGKDEIIKHCFRIKSQFTEGSIPIIYDELVTWGLINASS